MWFPPNVWPSEVPELRAAAERYLAAMTTVSRDLLRLCADAWAVPPDSLAALAQHPTWTFNINRYPPLTEVGPPLPGQFRIGPHTDFGTVTVLDREPGAGGLQIDIEGRGWVDAPYDPDAFTVNIGDLLAHWTGLRWRSGRHRVLPPQAGAPPRSSCRWCSSSSSTTTRWSRRSHRRWGGGGTCLRSCQRRSCGSGWTPSRSR